MCGRFTLTVESIVISERFDVSVEGLAWKPRYNIAPTQICPIVMMKDQKRMLAQMNWGLVPHWSKNKKFSFQMINARAETIKSKPIFRKLFQTQRCLVPADSFFEWKKESEKKIPFRFSLKNNRLFAFAGLWDLWQSEKEVIRSFTILTTNANSIVAELHDRMPVILKQEDEALWLNPAQDLSSLEAILKPYPSREMQFFEVSASVNSWKNDNPECIQPAKK